MKTTHIRPAIAMLELIFAIAVMGIVLLSAPMLISMAAKSTSVALQQEGINEAASRITMIMTYDWDENNVNVPCGGNPSILHTASESTVTALAEVNGTSLRIGVPLTSNSHTFNCNGLEYNATSIGKEGSDIDDLDDFDKTNLVEVLLGSDGEDYIENPNTTGTNVSIDTTITYVSDSAPYNNTFDYNFSDSAAGGTTSIKAIKVTLTSDSTEKELQKTIVMRAFSCNLGSYRFVRGRL